jgi:hypothetical protein
LRSCAHKRGVARLTVVVCSQRSGRHGGSILRRDAGEDSSGKRDLATCVAAHDPHFRCVVVRDVGEPGISALPRIAAGPQTRRNFRFWADSAPRPVAPGRTGVRAIAAIPLRARSTLHHPGRTRPKVEIAIARSDGPEAVRRRRTEFRLPQVDLTSLAAESCGPAYAPEASAGTRARLPHPCRTGPKQGNSACR